MRTLVGCLHKSFFMSKFLSSAFACQPKLLCSSLSQCMDDRQWSPLSILEKESEEKIALVKLNTGVPPNEVTCFKRLWQNAAIRACTDGAINNLYDLFPSQRDVFIPDYVSGDFDSAKPDILAYYEEKGVRVLPTPDQDHTDFTKCLQILTTEFDERLKEVAAIVVHATEAGRFDHVMGNINTLFLAQKMTSLPVYIVSSNSLLFLVPKGKHVLDVSSQLRGVSCGLIPIGSPCHHVTTTGLKYNLSNGKLQFGAVVSTSNTYDGDKPITIQSDKPLLWTMELNSDAWK